MSVDSTHAHELHPIGIDVELHRFFRARALQHVSQCWHGETRTGDVIQKLFIRAQANSRTPRHRVAIHRSTPVVNRFYFISRVGIGVDLAVLYQQRPILPPRPYLGCIIEFLSQGARFTRPSL